jgi:hypothetical protein
LWSDKFAEYPIKTMVMIALIKGDFQKTNMRIFCFAKDLGCMGGQYFCIRAADTKIRPAGLSAPIPCAPQALGFLKSSKSEVT